MEVLLEIGKALLMLVAIASVVEPIISQRHNYRFIWSIWRRFRLIIFFECLGLILLTVVIGFILIQVPGFKYGWLNLFGGSGNIAIQPIRNLSDSHSPLLRLIVPIFFLTLAFVLPFCAHWEEKSFRQGHYEWAAIIPYSIGFGLIHCLAGVPIGLGVALIIPGLFYGLKYKRSFHRNINTMSHSQAEDEAVMISTTYHTMYNLIVIGILTLVSLLAVWK